MKIVSNFIRNLPDSQYKWKLILAMAKFYQFDIRIAERKEELRAIYKFRYKIYVEQLQRKQKYVNHTLKEIQEPLDETAYNIGAWKNGELVGVVRLNIKERGNFGYYHKLYRTDLFIELIERSSIVTKLMVDKRFRNTPLSILLSLACYQIGCKKSLEINFIDCNKHLVKYFLGT